MGGVLARAYIQGLAQGRNGKELAYTPHVASLVTVGAPHSGIAPEANANHSIYLRGFPKGQDDWGVQVFSPQISAYQCGQHWSFVLAVQYGPYVFGPMFFSGYIPYQLANTNSLVAWLPTLALYGLTTERDGAATLDNGDYLISFYGQRFRPEYQAGNLKLGQAVNNYLLTECVLGNAWSEKALPGQTNPWPSSATPHSDCYGYRHSYGSLYPEDTQATPEVYIHSWQAEWHATWLNLKKWLAERITFPTPTGACMVVDLVSGEMEELDGPPADLLTNDLYKSTKIVLMRIPAGTFTMGSPEDELGRDGNEAQHQVTLTKDFYIGVFEVTQKQYETVMGTNPSGCLGDYRPVEIVSWFDARGGDWPGDPAGSGEPDINSFIGKLRSLTAYSLFDLPTEAQWEYACRAGTTTALNSGKDLVDFWDDPSMDEVGRYWYNQDDGKGGYSGHTTVGSYLPNNWGLYDMHGNVFEWCLDWYAWDYPEVAIDPLGAELGDSLRTFRGGCYGDFAGRCRSATRPSLSHWYSDDFYGFRLAAGQ